MLPLVLLACATDTPIPPAEPPTDAPTPRLHAEGTRPWDGVGRPDVWLDDEATLSAKLAAYGGVNAPNDDVVAAIAPDVRE